MGSSNWWQTLSPLTSGENIVTKYYYENPVTKMKIEMNGKSHTFTMMHGKTLRDMVNSPENTYCADAKGRLNTKTNPWAMTRNGHEPYMCTKMCFNVNYKNHACQNKQKIGFALSQEAPCGHPGTGEGLGMIETCSNDNLASGRLQWSSETNYPHNAKVYVWASDADTLSPTNSPTAHPTNFPTAHPTSAPTGILSHNTCAHTKCTYTGGTTFVSSNTQYGEKWHCEKSGNACKCVCHSSLSCNIRHHHTTGYKKTFTHC